MEVVVGGAALVIQTGTYSLSIILSVDPGSGSHCNGLTSLDFGPVEMPVNNNKQRSHLGDEELAQSQINLKSTGRN